MVFSFKGFFRGLIQNFLLLPEKPRLLTVVPPERRPPPERLPLSVLMGVRRTVEWV